MRTRERESRGQSEREGAKLRELERERVGD